jgi:hypothetical protein
MLYVWFIWSLILLALWGLVYFLKKDSRKEMLKMSWITMPFGLTEFLFVPEYWHPPSLFDLAIKTGFDLESLIFSFEIGGIGTALYNLIFKRRYVEFPNTERSHSRHSVHVYMLFVPVVIFVALSLFTNLNHIYCGIFAMFLGGLSTLYCRPDLKKKIWIGGLLFMVLYFVYFGSILSFYPDYVEQYWNLENLTHILVLGIPIEELLFAFTFGMFWPGLYEHLYWKKLIEPMAIS